MPKFDVKIQREIDCQIEADTLANAEKIARDLVANIPNSKLMSIHIEGYVEPAEPEKPTPPFRGKPTGGGTPGTPVVKTEVLVDQIAEAA